MLSANDLIGEFAEQEVADPEEVLNTLVEFSVEYGLAEDAVAALGAWIDEEQLSQELTMFMQQKGVGVEGD